MIKNDHFKKSPQSDGDLAQMVINVAEATHVDSIICVTETGALALRLHQLSRPFRLIASTTNKATFESLKKRGLEVIHLPLHTVDKYT